MKYKWKSGDILFNEKRNIYAIVELEPEYTSYKKYWITIIGSINNKVKIPPYKEFSLFYRDKRIEEYKEEIKKFLIEIERFDKVDWRKIKEEYEKIERKCIDLIDGLRKKYVEDEGNCFSYVQHTFKELENFDEYWQNLKQKQETEKFRRGDLEAELGGKYGRNYGIRDGKCVLCEEHNIGIFFDDNESYDEEFVCKGCLKTFLDIINAKGK